MLEMFLAKLTKQLLRGIRVDCLEKLRARIVRYLDQLNADPVLFRWKYGLDQNRVLDMNRSTSKTCPVF